MSRASARRRSWRSTTADATPDVAASARREHRGAGGRAGHAERDHGRCAWAPSCSPRCSSRRIEPASAAQQLEEHGIVPETAVLVAFRPGASARTTANLHHELAQRERASSRPLEHQRCLAAIPDTDEARSALRKALGPALPWASAIRCEGPTGLRTRPARRGGRRPRRTRWPGRWCATGRRRRCSCRARWGRRRSPPTARAGADPRLRRGARHGPDALAECVPRREPLVAALGRGAARAQADARLPHASRGGADRPRPPQHRRRSWSCGWPCARSSSAAARSGRNPSRRTRDRRAGARWCPAGRCRAGSRCSAGPRAAGPGRAPLERVAGIPRHVAALVADPLDDAHERQCV